MSGISTPGAPIVVTEPASEPVTLTEAKLQCKVDHTAEDTLLSGWIVAARRLAESHMNRLIMPQTVRATWMRFPSGCKWEDRALRLPGGQVREIDSLSYFSTDDEWVELAEDEFAADLDNVPALLYPAPGLSWPITRSSRPACVKVQYKAGWATTCPEDLKAAILLMVGYWHNNRGDAKDVGDGIPMGVQRLLDYYRLPEYR